MLAAPIRIAWRFIKAMLIVLFVAIVLLWFGAAYAGECTDFICPGEKRNITVPGSTGIGRTIIGDVYNPGPGRRLQIREKSDTGIGSRIIGYIEPSGRITDTRRREIGNIGEFFGNSR